MKAKRIILAVFLTIGFLALSIEVRADEPVTGPVAIPIHWTRLVQPKPNSLLQGVVTVEVVKNENVEIELNRVEIYFNQDLLKTFYSSPYIFNWDTSLSSTPGGCILIKAYDNDDNLDDPVCYPVLINNELNN